MFYISTPLSFDKEIFKRPEIEVNLFVCWYYSGNVPSKPLEARKSTIVVRDRNVTVGSQEELKEGGGFGGGIMSSGGGRAWQLLELDIV